MSASTFIPVMIDMAILGYYLVLSQLWYERYVILHQSFLYVCTLTENTPTHTRARTHTHTHTMCVYVFVCVHTFEVWQEFYTSLLEEICLMRMFS